MECQNSCMADIQAINCALQSIVGHKKKMDVEEEIVAAVFVQLCCFFY